MTKYTHKQTETRNWSGGGKEPGREHRHHAQLQRCMKFYEFVSRMSYLVLCPQKELSLDRLLLLFATTNTNKQTWNGSVTTRTNY